MTDPTDLLATQGVAVMAIPVIVEWMKQSNLPFLQWIAQEKSAVSRTVAWGLGILVAAGIHISGHYDPATGHVNLIADGLSVHNLLVIVGQLFGQEHVYSFLRMVNVVTQSASAIGKISQATDVAMHGTPPWIGKP